ncbi:MAG: SufS family cysteine desulfurase [Bowdeniella nasicola]|nr:SufS family cysteine desulfurase [Bowdeniella nasicola]
MAASASKPPVDRADFPGLFRQVGDHELVYLDSAATALKPQQVIDAEADFYTRLDGAVHRGSHTIGMEATDVYERSRGRLAAFVGAGEKEIVWTKNATEAINLVAYGVLNATLDARAGQRVDPRLVIGAGETIAVTEAEHHANFVPWQQLARRIGANFHIVPVSDDGVISAEGIAELPDNTRILAFTQASNVTGALSPVSALVAAARERGALTVMDSCQAAAHMRLDLHELDVDFAAFSAHKMLGPTGIGALYGRHELLSAMPPFLTGGSMVAVVTGTATRFMPPPQRFEAGTQMTAQVAAWGSAIDYLDAVGMDRIEAYDSDLAAYLLEGIASIPRVRIMGPKQGPRLGLVAFQLGAIHPHDVGQFLDFAGIAVRVGHHCAQPIHRRLGVQSSTRASVGPYNTRQDIDILVERLGQVSSFFGDD